MVELEELCDALERNDPNVTGVSTTSLIRGNYEPDDDFEDLTLRLGTAIRHNTVVSELDLDLALLVRANDTSISDDAADLLMDWIRKSPALRSVRLVRTTQFGRLRNPSGRPAAVVEKVLHVMARNPHIRELRSSLSNLPWPLLTEYLTHNKLLETLWLMGSQVSNGAPNLVAASQAIKALPGLEELALPAEEEFLHLLQSRPTLRKLGLKFEYDDPTVNTKMESFASAMKTCTNLTSVALDSLTMDRDCWGLVESGFRANSAITHFQLHCTLKKDAADVIFAYLGSNDQPIRNLKFTGESENPQIATKVAKMLRESLLDHISLDAADFGFDGTETLFNDLTKHTEEVRVKSIYLDRILYDTLLHIGQYIPTAVHLLKLGLDIYPFFFDHLWDNGPNPELRVMSAFLVAMRQNGSLHSVEICSGEKGFPSDSALRIIDAYTSRNRLVPEVLQDLLHRRREAKETQSDSALKPLLPSLSLVPTLCKVAMQADRMAPNTVLRGLQAGLQEIGRSSDSGKKRLNSQRGTSTSTDA